MAKKELRGRDKAAILLVSLGPEVAGLIYKQLDEDVYPDGMEFELAAGYNNWVVSEFAGILELADLNQRRAEVPADFLAKMEKMFNYLLLASMPNTPSMVGAIRLWTVVGCPRSFSADLTDGSSWSPS